MRLATTINIILEQYSQLSSLVIPSYMIMLLEKSFCVHLAAGSVAAELFMQHCVMIGSRQIFVGRKWYYMNAYIRTSMCSIPLTTVVSGTLCTSLMGHTANSVSGRWMCLLSG